MTEDRQNKRLAEPEVEAARELLSRLGVRPDDLLAAPSESVPVPEFVDYVPQVARAVTEGTCRVYGSYWNMVTSHWGNRHLNEPTALEIRQLAEMARAGAVQRRNGRAGWSAAEHLIASVRCIYNHAVADGWITEGENPARRVAKPRRLQSTRRSLTNENLRALSRVAAQTGNDPALDTLLLRLHTETACRRGGAIGLRASDLDQEQCIVQLREKGDTKRWQPVSPTLMQHLLSHSLHLGPAGAAEQVLRYRDGHPITHRRYDHLWTRLGKHLPWVATQQVTTHWLRHTTLTWVERTFGYAVARAYAGHVEHPSASATTTYIRADVSEVATALATLTGEDHPLTHVPANKTST